MKKWNHTYLHTNAKTMTRHPLLITAHPLPYTGGLLPGLTSSVEAVDVAVDLERKMIVIISFRPDNFCSRGVFS